MERRQRLGMARPVDQQSRFPFRALEMHTSRSFMCSGKSRRQARYVFGIVDVRSTSNAARDRNLLVSAPIEVQLTLNCLRVALLMI